MDDADAVKAEPDWMGGVVGGVIVQILGANGARVFDTAQLKLFVVAKH
ncbi:hypothetical protein [Candidatus Viadribacter manganicus]|nr:hypothetical protein [Candidatus Viadribacter manganicus]